MAKLFPDKQEHVDLKDGDRYSLTKVTITNATSNFVTLAGAADVALLQAAKTTSDPTFYLTQGTVNIDGATVGDKYTIVSRHRNTVNFSEGGS